MAAGVRIMRGNIRSAISVLLAVTKTVSQKDLIQLVIHLITRLRKPFSVSVEMRLLQAKIVDDSSFAWASFIEFELARKSKLERIVEKGNAWEEWRYRRVVIDDPPRTRNANILLEEVVGGRNDGDDKKVWARASRTAASDDDMVC